LASATVRPVATHTIISDPIAGPATSPSASMTIEKGITEIADSEEEPMTSSPVDVSDAAARDRLSAQAPVPPRERQDALPEADGTHQALAQGIANTASDKAAGLNADRNHAPVDVHASNNDRTDTKLDDTVATQQEGATAEQCNDDQEVLAQKQSPQGNFRGDDLPIEHINAVKQERSTDQAQHDGDLPVQHGSIDDRSSKQDANHVLSEGLHEPEAAGERPADAAIEPTANHQEQQSVSKALTKEGGIRQVYEEQGQIEKKQVEQSKDDKPKAADAPSEAPSAVEDELLRSDSDPREVSTQSQDIVMSDDLPQKQADDADQTPSLGMDGDRASEHAVCLRPTHLSSRFAHVDQANIPKATAATASESAELSEAVIDPTRTPTSEAAEQTSASLTVTQENTHSHRGAKDLQGPVEDTEMIMDAHTADAGPEEPSPSAGEMSRMREDEQRGSDATPIFPPAESTSQPLSDSPVQPLPVPARPTPPKTPQEITLAELKAQKVALLASLGTLPAIQVLMEESASSDLEMDASDEGPTETDIMAAANKIVKEHIKLLHEYNEMKDVGQGLMGLIADQRGVRIVEVQEEFGIDAKD
jgi:hypothetical protein